MATDALGTHLRVLALRSSITLGALAVCVGCDGQLLGNGDFADVGAGPGLTAGAGNGGAGTDNTPTGEKPLDCSKAQVAAAPLRRLTREQHDNSIRDLFGRIGHPSLALAADEKLSAFFSNLVSLAQLMGVADMEKFGSTDTKRGNLTGFV